MIEHADDRSEFWDVEQIVRAAGDYLDVSDDLRPRTLEEARDNCRETATRSWMAALGMVSIVLAMYAGRFHDRIAFDSPSPFNGAELYVAARQASADPGWSLVDAFRGLRERQASLIEDAFF